MTKSLMKRLLCCSFLLGALSAATALGCTGRVMDDSGPSEEPSCQMTLGFRLVRHTCSHTENGPYVDIAAQSAGTQPADVSQLHKPFDVTAVSVPFTLRYQASREGAHLIFTDKPVEWKVSKEDGAPALVQTNVSAPSESGDSCSGTTHATLAPFQLGESYTLTGSTTTKRFILFVEHAETFGDDAFLNTCSNEQ